MKRIPLCILILLVAVQSFSKWLILLDYRMHQDYVAQVLCENREKPQLLCKGQCQLRKKLAAENADASAHESTPKKVQFAEVLFVTATDLVQAAPVVTTDRLHVNRYQLRKYDTPPTAVFHPPLSC